MTAWNSTFKTPGQPLKRSPMTRRSSRKTATKQERNYMSAQADAGCILCRFLGLGDTPAEIHHLRDGVGSGQRNSNLLTIPLCPEHHRGNTGFHGMGRRAFEREYGVTEMDLWAMAQKQNPATLAGVPGLQSHLE
ncbi:hypothetical protein PT7_P073 (plasmid) [Pusillimonas sp. T7-7]|nr:hypothetical protein PT7_P073 [Pusillimonas sp. T7-7]